MRGMVRGALVVEGLRSLRDAGGLAGFLHPTSASPSCVGKTPRSKEEDLGLTDRQSAPGDARASGSGWLWDPRQARDPLSPPGGCPWWQISPAMVQGW